MKFLRLLPVMFGIAFLSAVWIVFHPAPNETTPRDPHKIMQQWNTPKKIMRPHE